MSTIIRWNPVRRTPAPVSAFDRWVDEAWRNWNNSAAEETRALALDVHENDASYIVTTALPGVEADNINIKLDDDVLTIEGEIPATTTENKEGRVLVQERHYGKFSRSIRLPLAVNSDGVDANFENGVLTLTLPKTPEVQPRTIPVKAGNSHSRS